MSASIGAATSGSRPEPISGTYRRLRRIGFDDREAANLTAVKNGIGITSQPWTVRELAHLLFLRESWCVGRRWSDAVDRADWSDPTGGPAVDGAPGRAVGDGAAVSARPSRHRDDADPADGRVTLLTLFRKTAGPNATLHPHLQTAPPRLDAAGDSEREGG